MVEAQCLAATVLGQVLDGRSLDAELAAAWRRHGALDAHNRAVAQDLAYGTLRFLPRFEALLEALLDKPLKDAQLRALLLVVLYQLERTRAAPHAVVDHAVRTCGVLGLASAKGLVNAVLRNFLRRRTELDAHVQRSEAARYCHPQWWIDRLRAQYPGRYVRALEAGNRHPPLALRVNRRRADAASYLELLARHGIQGEAYGAAAVILDKALPAERIPGLAEGLVSVQDPAAQLAAPLLDLEDGMQVLDACAAPGGSGRRQARAGARQPGAPRARGAGRVRRCRRAGALVGRDAVPAHPARCAVQRLGHRATASRRQVAAARDRCRAIRAHAGRDARGAVADPRQWW